MGGACSGAGKTTLTAAILAACHRRSIAVRAAKSGPDYIDPGFHAAATGAPCPNLDTWAMAPAQLDAVVRDLARGADYVLVESAMGLFDGVEAEAGRSGAAADLAARYHLPVLLVLDVTGQSQSAAAVVRGFMQHDPAVRIGGVVLNRLGSTRHRDAIARALSPLDVPVLGGLPRDASIALSQRHLGLVQAREHTSLDGLLERLSALAERYLDLRGILELAAPLVTDCRSIPVLLPPPGQRIALGCDAAFSFIYPHLLNGWRTAGAEIVTFSPLADEPPPPDCDCCWLPGGYPELHAARLAEAGTFRSGLISFAETRQVHGECGGYMVLGTMLLDHSGNRHRMLGLLSHATSFAQRRLHLGYRQARLLDDCALGSQGTLVRGHEFHYTSLTDPGTDAPFCMFLNAAGEQLGPAGGRRGNVSGSFFHVIACDPPTGACQ